MANSGLTPLIPSIYAARDQVAAERTGFLSSVTIDASGDRVAQGQPVVIFKTRPHAAEDITPAMAIPAAANNTFDNVSLTISKARAVPFSWTGTEQKGVNTGPGFAAIRTNEIAEAMRTLRNEMEADVGLAVALAASRAYGTAGTTPFASDHKDTGQLKKILDDNGAPESGRQLVIDTAAGANLRGLVNLTRANENASDATLRRGALLDLNGFEIRESGRVALQPAGAGTSYAINNASNHAVGDTALTVDTGSGAIPAGNIITIAGDPNKYVVVSTVGGATVTQITIAAPGLRATAADNAAITVLSTAYRANAAFNRSTVLFASRAPDMPEEGDLAEDTLQIADPFTNIVYEFLVYKGRRMVRYEVAAAWGQVIVRPEFVALELG